MVRYNQNRFPSRPIRNYVPSNSVLGKRKFNNGSYTPYKRTRFYKDYSDSRYGKSSNFTSQSGIGGGIRFKSRSVPSKQWRDMLWSNSIQKDHYRSNTSGLSTINTPATISTMTVGSFPAYRLSSSNFYVAAGGAIAPDAAQALPVFTGKFVVRGGTLGVRICNTYDTTLASQNTNQGVVYLIKTTKNYTSASIPAAVNLGWDPTLIQDFKTTIGTILYRKEFLLRDADCATCEYRLPVHQVDPGDYINDRNSYIWIICAGNVDVAAARTFTYVGYFNLSFTADAV